MHVSIVSVSHTFILFPFNDNFFMYNIYNFYFLCFFINLYFLKYANRRYYLQKVLKLFINKIKNNIKKLRYIQFYLIKI